MVEVKDPGESEVSHHDRLFATNSDLYRSGGNHSPASHPHDGNARMEVPSSASSHQPSIIGIGASDTSPRVPDFARDLDVISNSHSSSNLEESILPDPNSTEAELASRRKLERVQAKRREGTLRRQFAERPRCLCTSDCHCMEDNGDPDITSTDRGGSSIDIEVLDPHLGRFLGRAPYINVLAGLGTLFNPEPRPSSSEGNSSTVAESTRTSSRLSQRTAVDGAVPSSRSRPTSAGRSSSAPLIQRRDRGGFYHPTPRDLRRRSETREDRHSTTDGETSTSRPPTTDDAASSASNSIDGSRNFRVPNHIGANDLANLPTPGSHEMPITPSRQVSAVGDSQEITPRPYSFDGAGNGSSGSARSLSETLTTALEELVNGISDDHSAVR